MMNISADPDSRLWATLAHLSALLAYFGIPFGHILGPLVVWLIKRNELPFVDDQGKEALNFQISMTIYGLGLAIVYCILLMGVLSTSLLFGVRAGGAAMGMMMLIFLPLGVFILIDVIFAIIAAIRANHGEYYRYPLSIRLIK